MQFTQIQAAKNLEWSQGAISHYLNNITELNPAAVVKFANFLDVDPIEIDPEIEDHLPHVQTLNLTYASSDMSKPLNKMLRVRKNDISTYVKISPSNNISTDEFEVVIPETEHAMLTGVAQLCTVQNHPRAKIFAVRKKGEKRLRFYLKENIPSDAEITKVWAVVSFLFI